MKVWWANGAALAKFEREIISKIDGALDNIEQRHAVIILRLYVIGKRVEESRPLVMVCCTDTQVKNDAESSIRRSGVLS